MRVIVDAMGGDRGPEEAVRGAVEASRDLGIEVLLVGDAKAIEPHLQGNHRVRCMHASEVIDPGDQPVTAIRQKRDSSMVLSLRALEKGEADAMVSAGNTGALLAGGLLVLGRVPSVERPAIAVTLPTLNGDPFVLLDVGANSEVKARNLLQFGLMGSLYAETVLGRNNAKVALLNIGAEPGKGTDLCKAAYELLEESGLNFIGNLEAREMLAGKADVVVCDGFVGNVLLKFAEGIGLVFLTVIQEEFRRTGWRQLGAALLKPALISMKGRMDYSGYGGALLLGLAGVCVKCHGSSDGTAFKNGVRVATEMVRNQTIPKLSRRLEEMNGVK